ncbi:MAG: 5-formyltetrahydrofolate cyclo-ligase [Methanomicrobiales archaeon]|jgi:5-formyltetrahydrofolate cyclo-ligase|nr:5-formyltetrahydrofolate cyclo-ligase [Methanomicrobiales archaeon]
MRVLLHHLLYVFPRDLCTTTTHSKHAIREEMKLRRATLPDDARAAKSSMIEEHLASLLGGHSPVMLYASKVHEVATHSLINRLLNKGTEVVLPIIEKETGTLRLSYLTSCSQLSVSTFSVPEPVGHEIPAAPQDLRAVVVPMLGFDRRGNRLGYGAGYYDRFLPKTNGAVIIGVAFACQEVMRVPVYHDDVGMDAIVTEEGICWCNPGAGMP